MRSDRLRRFALAIFAATAVVLVDQGTKTLARETLSTEHRIPLLGDLLGLRLAFNPGAIFSLGSGATGVITAVGVGATVVLVIATARTRSTGSAVGLGFILGGAVGNLIDRVFSPPAFGIGHVTDFLAYGELFIGNLADVALGIGALLLFADALGQGRSRPDRTPAASPAPSSESNEMAGGDDRRDS